MIKAEPIIAVAEVEKSSKWYQQLLNCKSAHGGNVFEILTDESGAQILSLHKWGEHDHRTLTAPGSSTGNGLILYFVVDNIKTIWANALALEAKIEEEPHLNTNSGRMEFSLRDLDGYYVSVTSDQRS